MVSCLVVNAFAAFFECHYSPNASGCTEYGTAPDSVSLSITGDLTVEAYVKITSIGLPQVVVSKRRNVANGGGYELWIDTTGHVNFTTYSNAAAVKATVASTNTITAGSWVHIGGEYSTNSTGSIKALCNGTITSVTSATGAADNGTSPLQIGRLLTGGGASGQCFAGGIDDVRISNTVRYMGSTGATYTVPTSYPASANTKAQYVFNVDTAISEDYTTDKSGNGNTLTFWSGGSTTTSPAGSCPGVF